MTEYLIPLCFDHQREHAEQIYGVLCTEGYTPHRDGVFVRPTHTAIRTYYKGTFKPVAEGLKDQDIKTRLIKFTPHASNKNTQ